MKDEQTAQGFSFQLSASAPPAEAVDRDPDSGPSWFASENERLDLDLDAFAASARPPSTTSTAEEVTRTPAPVDATSPPPPIAHAPKPHSATTHSESAESGPAVRRIEFPSRGRAPSPAEPAARSRKTVFSSSVSQAPRARLLSSDDAPEPEPVSAPQAPAPEQAAPRRSTPRAAALHPRPLQATSGVETQQRLLALARKGAAVGREHALSLGSKSALLARRAGEIGARYLRKGQERWALSRTKDAPVPAATEDTSSPELASDEASPPLDSGSPNLPETQARRSAAKKPWLSGGAAMVAAVGCYFGASHLLTFAAPGSTGAGAESAVVAEGDAPAEPSLSKAERNAPAGSSELAAQASEPSAIDEKSLPKAGKAAPPALEQLALPEGLNWPKKGLIEVVTSGSELVYVDGVFTGRGPLRRIPIAPGSHEVEVRTEGQQRKARLDVSVGKRARVVFGD